MLFVFNRLILSGHLESPKCNDIECRVVQSEEYQGYVIFLHSCTPANLPLATGTGLAKIVCKILMDRPLQLVDLVLGQQETHT